jgi:hypothetical protein
MYVKPIPACPSCFGDQKMHGKHENWLDCQAEMKREDLRSPARRYRPRSSGISSTSWSGTYGQRSYA